jgi:hypothetical protein
MSTAIKLQDITIHPVIESQAPLFDAMTGRVRRWGDGYKFVG